tara:strand:- start:17110 stop:17448 length:339 start_codon:yes stop_codon:yes gene_type:complete
MKWSYTEGKINVSVDDSYHEFRIEDLVNETLLRKDLKRKVIITFGVCFVVLMSLQLYGGGFPENQNFYFYIGYFLTPAIFAAIISFLGFILFKKSRRESKNLNYLFKKEDLV